jgi:Putative adhesin
MIAARLVCVSATLLLAGCFISAAGYRYDRTFDQGFDARGVRTLEIRTGIGDLQLVPGAAVLRIRGVIRASSLDAVRNVSFESRRLGDRLILTADENGGRIVVNFTSRYEIRYPPDVALDIHTGSGDIALQSPRSVASAQSGSGNVKFLNAHGDVNISTASGNVTVTLSPQWAGNLVYIGTASGDQHLTLPPAFRGHLVTRTTTGTVTDKSEAHQTSAKTAATISLRSTSGNIVIAP